ncbi:MAG: hypothetical protein IPL96_13430 [Holophagaceae bacterium]|nr:hypothetical protein [Holophagaceae bacterium]
MLFIPPALIAQDLPNEAYLTKQRDTWLNVAQNSKHDMEAWHKVGEFELQLGHADAAIAAESKAIAMHPKYAAAYAGRARAHFDRRDFAATRADATKVIELLEARGGLQKYLEVERPPEHYIASYRLRGLANAWESKWEPAFADLAVAARLALTTRSWRWSAPRSSKKPSAPRTPSRAACGLGSLFADGGVKAKAEEQAAALKRLGGTREAAQVEAKLASKQPKSDLPD